MRFAHFTFLDILQMFIAAWRLDLNEVDDDISHQFYM